MKSLGIIFVLAIASVPIASHAQSNPFAPPARTTPPPPPAPAPASEPDDAAVQEIPSQPGTPSGSPVNGNPAAGLPTGNDGTFIPQEPVIVDPIAELIADEGVFVGCIGNTPVFKDKFGRRAYFTSKEMKESNEARRFTRC